MKSPFKDRLLLLAFFLVLLVFGVWAVRTYFVSQPIAPSTTAPADIAEEKESREVILYFGSAGATHLVPETREIEDCQAESDCLRKIVQALIDGPVGDLVPILPASTVIRDLQLQNSTAVISFSSDLVSAHPGGSISELLSVYGLADTLAVNFPHIRQVRIMVEGKPVETLKGHIGLQEPVLADFRYTRPPEESAAGGIEAPAAEGEGR